MNTTPIIQQPANYQPEQELFKLRRKLSDLIRMGAATPETFMQALMQIFQETDKRRISCLAEAEDHLRKYQALLSQAHAFTAQSSIAFAVIDGYVKIEERRAQELAERAQEKAQQEAAQKAEDEAKAQQEPAQTNGLQAHEGATDAVPSQKAPKAKPSGGKRKKP